MASVYARLVGIANASKRERQRMVLVRDELTRKQRSFVKENLVPLNATARNKLNPRHRR